MKKVLFVLLALAVMGSVAFAEVNVSAYGLGFWNVAANGESRIESSIASQWPGLGAPYIGMTFSGRSDNVRFAMSATAGGGSLYLGSSYVEILPVDWAAFTFGKFAMTETEVGATFGSRNWYRLGSVRSADIGDFIFASLLDGGVSGYINDGGGNRGAMNARFYPIEGLTIGFQAPLAYAVNGNDSTTSIGAVWGNANAYVRYDIDGIGSVRLGWDSRTKSGLGENDDYVSVDLSKFNNVENGWWGIIAAAFELKLAALPELYVGVGARIPTQKVSSNFTGANGGRPYEANLYARYNLDIVTPLTFHALFGSKINEENVDNSTYDNFGFYVGAGVDVGVFENVTVFADVRYANGIYMNRSNASGEDNLTFGVGISRAFSNGLLGIAFVGSTNGYGNGIDGHRSFSAPSGWSADSCSKEFVWAVPVKFQIMF